LRRCLDTTFVSLLVRSDAPTLDRAKRWADAGETVATTEVNYYEVALGIELTEGSAKRDRYARAWGLIQSSVEVLPLTRRATLEAVRREAQLYRSGVPASLSDLFVAAIAKTQGCESIVTRDVRGFERIGLLKVEPH
jgi:predicted nucleic acid-binding protein